VQSPFGEANSRRVDRETIDHVNAPDWRRLFSEIAIVQQINLWEIDVFHGVNGFRDNSL
jgi:hypothetical protein